MSEVPGWVPIVISWLAAAIALWAARDARKAASKSTSVQEAMLALEQERDRESQRAAAKARVVAFVSRAGDQATLYLRNEGQATARQIKVLLDGTPLEKHELVDPPNPPITTLGPQAETPSG
jgi:hypothetical protein